MDIYYEYANDFFYNRYNEVIEKAAKAAKAKTASYISKYKGNNDSFRQSPGFKIPSTVKVVPFEGDPKNMNTKEVEKLARNVFSVTPELDEIRSVYQLLHLVANHNSTEREFYFDFLAQNLRTIIENFFDQELELDEMQAVIDEISGSMIRFANVPALDDVIIGITEVLIEFITIYQKEKADEAIEDDLDEAAQLQREMLAIT
jgi:hypothetical protein